MFTFEGFKKYLKRKEKKRKNDWKEKTIETSERKKSF
jgi:hypothetical protein